MVIKEELQDFNEAAMEEIQSMRVEIADVEDRRTKDVETLIEMLKGMLTDLMPAESREVRQQSKQKEKQEAKQEEKQEGKQEEEVQTEVESKSRVARQQKEQKKLQAEPRVQQQPQQQPHCRRRSSHCGLTLRKGVL